MNLSHESHNNLTTCRASLAFHHIVQMVLGAQETNVHTKPASSNKQTTTAHHSQNMKSRCVRANTTTSQHECDTHGQQNKKISTNASAQWTTHNDATHKACERNVVFV